MKTIKFLILAVLLSLIAATAQPVNAQLGITDVASFTIQNIDTSPVSVTIIFVEEGGTTRTPTTLNSGKSNPFTLNPGESFEIYVPGIPSSQLPAGRYSVEVQSTGRVVAIANLVGQGAVNFNGSYSGFSSVEASKTFYLPAVVYNYYGWYSLISVQNTGSNDTNVTVTIKCENGATGTLSDTIKPKASRHFVLKNEIPQGFTASTRCNGSAIITSTVADIVAVDNQSAPTGGNTQSYSGIASGATKIYTPALYTNYYGWNSSINIQKVGSGNTTVTVTYSDSTTPSTCNLTDSQPGCLLYMPSTHPTRGYYGATIISSGTPIVAVVNAANGSQAQTYNAIGGGTSTVGIPSVMKSYYGWNTSFTCQNVGSVDTTLNIKYDRFSANAYNTPVLRPGESIEKFTPGESFLPNGYQGGVTVTANASGAQIACIVNFNNPTQMASTRGDWSMSYNAFNR